MAGILVAALILLACPAAAAGEQVFTKKDCTCQGYNLPSYTDAFLSDAPQNGYYALTCQYGGYANIPYAGKGKGVQFDVHKESAEAAKGEYLDRQKVILPVLEGVKNDKTRHLIEYIPPGPASVSLMYTYPSTSSGSTVHNGQRVIIYKTNYYIFVSGIGYDLGDGELASMMDSAESCAKAIADAKEGGSSAPQEITARLVVLGGEVTLNGNVVDPREGGVVLRDRDMIETTGWLSPGWGYLMYTDRTLLRVEPGSKFMYHPDSLDLIIGGIWYRAEKQGQQFRIYTPYSSGAPKGTTFEIDVAPDGTSGIYVYEGQVAFSDMGNSKTVTVGAGQNSTCSKGGVPSDPKPFDQNAVDKWWEKSPPIPADAGSGSPAAPSATKKTPGFEAAFAVLACAAVFGAIIVRRR